MSSLAEIAEVLDKVDDLLCSEENFCQMYYGKDADGFRVSQSMFFALPEHGGPVQFCIRGAVMYACQGSSSILYGDVTRLLTNKAYKLYGTHSLFNVNDDHDKYQSYRMVRRIIDEARKEV